MRDGKDITPEAIEKLLKKPEGAGLEFKAADKGHFSVDKLGMHCCAIANAGGGCILLGITDKEREVVGTNSYPEPKEVEAAVADNLTPAIRVEIRAVEFRQKRVVVVRVPPRTSGRLIRHKRTPYTRIGEQTREMQDNEINRILTEPKTHWLYEVCLPDQGAEEVMALLDVKSFYRMIDKPMPSDLSLVMQNLADECILVPKKAKRRFSISRMGVLLLAHSIKKCSPEMAEKRVRIIRFEGVSKSEIAFSYDYDKGYASGFEDMLDMAVEQIAYQAEDMQGSAAEIAPQLAIRELLANAIIHQDFERNAQVILRIFSDEVELINPGASLVNSDFMMQHSESRNIGLLGLMRKFGLAEHATSGVEKVVAAIEESKSSPPEFKFQDGFTDVKLYRNADYKTMSSSTRKTAGHQHCLLRHARKSVMTNASLRERFGLNEDARKEIAQLLKELVEDQKIKPAPGRPGAKKSAGYIPYWG